MMNKQDTYNSHLLLELEQSISKSTEDKINRQMALAVRIDEAIKSKGWTQKEFASRMNKKPSEISRWLSGSHNFTTDTLWKIEDVIGIRLLLLDENSTLAA